MKKFSTVHEAFDWWIKNIYPDLSPDQKKGKLTNAWRDYTHKGSMSESRMKEILIAYGHFEIQTIIIYKP